jgi:hypothetical protein
LPAASATLNPVADVKARAETPVHKGDEYCGVLAGYVGGRERSGWKETDAAVAEAPAGRAARSCAEYGVARAPRLNYGQCVISIQADAAALACWITPDLPLYGNDHERGDFAP